MSKKKNCKHKKFVEIENFAQEYKCADCEIALSLTDSVELLNGNKAVLKEYGLPEETEYEQIVVLRRIK